MAGRVSSYRFDLEQLDLDSRQSKAVQQICADAGPHGYGSIGRQASEMLTAAQHRAWEELMNYRLFHGGRDGDLPLFTQFRAIAPKLSISPDQEARLARIAEAARTQRDALSAQVRSAEDQTIAQLRTLIADSKAQLIAMLTPQQRQAYLEALDSEKD